MPRFSIELTAEVEIEECVFKEVLSEEWRADFYDLRTREQVAAHIFYNLFRGVELTSLEGFADMLRTSAKIVRDSIDICGEEREAPPPRAKKPAKRKGAR